MEMKQVEVCAGSDGNLIICQTRDNHGNQEIQYVEIHPDQIPILCKWLNGFLNIEIKNG